MSTITVFICSYGYRDLLANAIDSVLAQTKKVDRIVVVDDGKFDGCDEVARKYNVEYIIREKNIGTIKNYNDLLFNQVKTDKMMILAADDYLRMDALEKMDLPFDIVSSDIYLVGNNVNDCLGGKKIEKKDGNLIWRFNPYHGNLAIKHNIRRKNFIHGSSLYNVEVAKKVGGYEQSSNSKKNGRVLHRLEEDWCLFQRMIGSGCSYEHVAEPLLYYRRHCYNYNGQY